MNINSSRRRFLSCGAASLALLPFAPLARAAGDAENTIAAQEDAARRFTVETRVNGHGPYRFLIDTGADRTILAEDIAANLRLPRGRRVAVVDIAGAVEADAVAIDELGFGYGSKALFEAPVLPRRWLEADGYLGIDVLAGHRVVFDFKEHRLGIFRSRSAEFLEQDRINEIVVPLSGSAGRLIAVDCRVEGVRTFAFIDSGAEVSVGNSRLLAEVSKRRTPFVRPDPVTLTGITGATVTGRAIAVQRVRMGGLDFSHDGIVIADLPIFDVWDLAQRPALFIGMDLLRHFSRVTIDYTRKQYRLEIASLNIAKVL